MYPTWQHYKIDPVASDNTLSESELAHILGGEATMWGEWVSPETIDSRIWPRTAAIAERLWSPASVTDVDDMYRRLDAVSLELEELGLTHEKNVDMMLRRLARTKEIGPLKTLLSVVEPVKQYHRAQTHPATMLSPLTRLIDAATPDSRAAREFSELVDGLLSDAPRFRQNKDTIKAVLMQWAETYFDSDASRHAIHALGQRIVVGWGVYDSLLLASTYVPTASILKARMAQCAEDVPETERPQWINPQWLSDTPIHDLARLAAILAPFAVGQAATSLLRLT